MKASEIISRLGFPSVRGFQAAWNLGTPLVIDGVIGDKTTAAAAKSWTRNAHGRADLSDHFSAREFRCKCGGIYSGCANVKVRRELLGSLEKYRTAFAPTGLLIVSGYRCPVHNRKVGGATASQHLDGRAADIHGAVPYARVEAHHWFAGYGIAPNGTVVHVDRRDLVKKATLTKPDHWYY
ncbi:MAG TPA: D-Ala-D-Ala carboxypeptidase family metallohydrolase [Candidatus Paceibacterota bacterium]|nr:D-Ala-D-Ala carboxypeptidase family metallohydrolase [Candidatus Paceibacterota bacterium]